MKDDKPQKKTRTKKKSGEMEKKDFLCVGLGASAGGVRALQDFFAAMPPNSGMAFVVVLHLAPNQESSLSQILQAQTTMPVVQVNETHKVEPNHVYVIPPNHHLEMVDGTVRLAEPEREKGARVAIDVFFRTLAQAYERNAVCVVLSGTGSDGTLGLKRIKETNGFAVVQEPADAEYDQMPRSAISTGIADWVLPVRQMPEKLIRFKESSERLHLTDRGDARKVAEEINAEDSLREILTILRIRTGHDFSNYKTPTLVRRIARHLQIHELEDIPTYLNFLRDNPEEVLSLQRNLLINVTNFFRDRESFDVLEKEIVPKIMAGKTSRDSVRVWSAACASGEEAYSIGILLHEYAAEMPDPPKIQIFATDVDDEALAEAREGVYPDAIETDVSEDRLKRFFVKEGKRYRVRKELRESILFAPHNVLRDPPFSKLDLVTCRNLLIYLNRETQERVIEIFHFALNLHGYLFLGSSETAESLPSLFSVIDKKNRVYQRRATHGKFTMPPSLPSGGQWFVKPPEARAKGGRSLGFALGEVHYKLLENLAPPSILVNQDFDVVYTSETVGRFLRFVGGEPTNNVLKLIHTDLLPDLRAALFTAKHERGVSEFPNLRVHLDGEETLINLIVRSVSDDDGNSDFLLVIFDEPGRNSKRISADRANFENAINSEKTEQTSTKDGALESIVQRLETELQRTRMQLRATLEQHEVTIEELKASNEELQAINEELRSAGEELETSREELQSVNEELITVNHEHKEKIDEVSRANSDLQNLISSTEIATIFLDKTMRIKRFTPPVEALFNIGDTDLGRPLEHFTNRLNYGNVNEEAAQVLRTLKPVEREVTDRDGRCFLTRILPYRTLDDRIEGVVLNFVDITERKEAERAKFFLASIVESSGDSMITIDFDRKITSWNKSAENLYGYPAAEAVGKPLTMLTLPEDIKKVLANVDKIKHSQKVEIFDSIRLNKDGREMNLEVVLSPVKDGAGKVIGVSTVARDVTQRRRGEAALRESEERFRAMFEQANVGIVQVTVDGKLLMPNKGFCRMLGYSENKIKRLNLRDITHPDDYEKETELTRKLLAGEIPGYSIEKRYVRKDGNTVWGNMTASVVFSPEHDPQYVVAIVEDITERKTAEEALRKSEEHLNLILESVKDYAIITFDLKGRITSWNAGAEKTFGFSEKEAVGQKTHFIFTPEDIANKEPEKELETALKKGRAEDERWHIRKDNSRFYASGVMQPLRDGTTQGFVKVCRDQTQKLNVEKALREKDMLARMVAAQEGERRRIARDIHDHFGQQLTALRLKLETIREMCDEENICNEIEKAQKSVTALDADADFIAWELRPVALDDLGLRVALENFVREWSHHTKIPTEFHTSGLNRAPLDFEIETNLYRIAQEALNNIYKHAQADKVSVLLEKRKDLIVLIIEDNGKGFKTDDKKIRSRGIGLSGMSERAKIIGGELEIESEKGTGTTVYARIPLVNNI